MSNRREDGEGYSNTTKLLALTVVALISFMSYPIWAPYVPNIPWGGEDVDQGIKLTGTVNYANHSAVDSETVQFVNAEDQTATYTAAISGGSFITNRGPIDGGTFIQYINLGDCMMYLQEVVIPAAENYDHESYTVPNAVIFTNAATTGWNTLMTSGSVANSFTGGGSAATGNYTASAANSQSFDLKIELESNYAKLFRQYTDPFDGVEIAPVMWIRTSSSTGVYSTDSSEDFESWTAGNYTYFIMPIAQMTSASAIDVDSFWSIDLVFSDVGSYEFDAYLIDGSSMAYLKQSKSQTANPNSGETVSVHQLVDAFVISS